MLQEVWMEDHKECMKGLKEHMLDHKAHKKDHKEPKEGLKEPKEGLYRIQVHRRRLQDCQVEFWEDLKQRQRDQKRATQRDL